jgi:hypothetical protein
MDTLFMPCLAAVVTIMILRLKGWPHKPGPTNRDILDLYKEYGYEGLVVLAS